MIMRLACDLPDIYGRLILTKTVINSQRIYSRSLTIATAYPKHNIMRKCNSESSQNQIDFGVSHDVSFTDSEKVLTEFDICRK